MDILDVKNLTFSFDEGHPIINNVTFHVKRGEFVSLVGHNGSGKSTLAKLILGLYESERGIIRVFDMDLNRDHVKAIRHKTGIVFQNPDNQFVGSTVEDDIAFGLENHDVSYEEMHELVSEYARKVGMEEYLKTEPSSLSGGQKQRVALAGVLAMKPELIILDEATSMLDPKGKREIFDLIREMKKEDPNLTIISITHDVEEAYHSDRVLVLDHGEIVLSGSPTDVFHNEEKIVSLGLEQPFIYQLENEFKKQGFDFEPVTNIEEVVNVLCR